MLVVAVVTGKDSERWGEEGKKGRESETEEKVSYLNDFFLKIPMWCKILGILCFALF